MKYELVAGFETHVELSTKTKIFCSCATSFGDAPNSHCCEVCTGMPGTLPVLNRRVVEYAVMAGLATNCKVNKKSFMSRKNYSYPDLPKAYQITQGDVPLCEDGFVTLSSGGKIRINRIHIEEDAGKLVHGDDGVFIDYNRAGVPLIEIVSEPDIRSFEQAREYVEKLQILMRYIGISDCRMQEGSMRCDVNVSVRPVGSESFGVRTEIKNMNSISNIIRAMEYEYNRQCELLDAGEKVVQETLRFDDKTGTTSPMRSKEDAKDYRFFQEPDLMGIELCDEDIARISEEIPELADSRAHRYIETMGINEQDAVLLTRYRAVADFFEQTSPALKEPSVAAKFILGQIFASLSTESEKETFDIGVTPSQLKELLLLLEQGRINNNLAKLTLDKMLKSSKDMTEFLTAEDMQGMSEDTLHSLCLSAIEKNPVAVKDYKSGKEKALKAILGFVMRESRGKADAQHATEILQGFLD